MLVVDDDEHIRALVALALGDEGYEVVTAADGAAALERVAECAPDVILLDLDMPVMDGWAFAARYRAQPGPSAPVVVCTAGFASPEGAGDPGQLGAAGFVAKPFALEDLSAAIGRHAPGAGDVHGGA